MRRRSEGQECREAGSIFAVCLAMARDTHRSFSNLFPCLSCPACQACHRAGEMVARQPGHPAAAMANWRDFRRVGGRRWGSHPRRSTRAAATWASPGYEHPPGGPKPAQKRTPAAAWGTAAAGVDSDQTGARLARAIRSPGVEAAQPRRRRRPARPARPSRAMAPGAGMISPAMLTLWADCQVVPLASLPWKPALNIRS